MTSPEVAGVLLAAAELLEKPGAWTQGEFAKTASGDGTYWNSPDAVCWCAEGAIRHVGGGSDAIITLRRSLGLPGGLYPVAGWNDKHIRTQAEVVSALRSAAKSTGGQS